MELEAGEIVLEYITNNLLSETPSLSYTQITSEFILTDAEWEWYLEIVYRFFTIGNKRVCYFIHDFDYRDPFSSYDICNEVFREFQVTFITTPSLEASNGSAVPHERWWHKPLHADGLIINFFDEEGYYQGCSHIDGEIIYRQFLIETETPTVDDNLQNLIEAEIQAYLNSLLDSCFDAFLDLLFSVNMTIYLHCHMLSHLHWVDSEEHNEEESLLVMFKPIKEVW